MLANLIGFTFRFSFWVFFDTQIMNFIWKYVFLVIQNLRSTFTTQRSLKHCFYFENSPSFKWVKSCKLWRMRLKEKEQSSQDYAWTTFWWLFKAGRQKQIPQISTRVKKIQLFTAWTTSWISNSNARMPILFLSRHFSPVRLGYVTEVNWRRDTEETKYGDWASVFSFLLVIEILQCIQRIGDNTIIRYSQPLSWMTRTQFSKQILKKINYDTTRVDVLLMRLFLTVPVSASGWFRLVRPCLHGGAGPQTGEVTCGRWPHLSANVINLLIACVLRPVNTKVGDPRKVR